MQRSTANPIQKITLRCSVTRAVGIFQDITETVDRSVRVTLLTAVKITAKKEQIEISARIGEEVVVDFPRAKKI